VLSTRAVEDRCRYDATFRVACGREVPGHTTFSRFRQHLFAQAGLAEDLFYQVLYVCACSGLGRLGVVAGDGVKITANASKEASRTEAGLRRLAAQVMDGARKAAAGDEAREPPLPGTDLLPGGEIVPEPRSRAGRIAACLEELQGEREAAQAASREHGQAYLEALAAGTANGRPPAAVALAAWQLRLEQVIAAQQALIDDWQARRAAGAGSRAGRRPADPEQAAAARSARARLADLQAAAETEAAGAGEGKKPQRNVTDPGSRLMPVRGGGFTQGYNCQDAAADDRLMLGGYACQDTGDALQAQRLAAVAEKGAAVVAAAHAAHAADPALLRACHDRLCTLPDKHEHDPGHDIAACHHAMTSAIGVLVEDAGYHSDANLSSPGPDRLIADGKTRDLARCQSASGPPPAGATAVEANAHRLRTPRGPRRLQAPCPRRRGPARQPQRQRRPAPLQPPRPAQRHQRVPVRRPRPQPPPPGRRQLKQHPVARPRDRAAACPKTASNHTRAPQTRHTGQPAKPRAHPEPARDRSCLGRVTRTRLAAGNCNSPYGDRNCP
jgi:hypothetical protein